MLIAGVRFLSKEHFSENSFLWNSVVKVTVSGYNGVGVDVPSVIKGGKEHCISSTVVCDIVRWIQRRADLACPDGLFSGLQCVSLRGA